MNASLVVDDDRIIGTMIKATLGDLGYRVDAVTSGVTLRWNA